MKFSTESIQKLGGDEAMTVILKQRTCRDENGKAVPAGHPDSRFLVGPAGAKITDKAADALGLKNGAIPIDEKSEPGVKESKPPETKEVEQKETKDSDKPKGGLLNKVFGGGDSKPDEKESDKRNRDERFKDAMVDMAAEAENSEEEKKKLFTDSGKPDATVLSTRVGENISGTDRDTLWAEVSKEL